MRKFRQENLSVVRETGRVTDKVKSRLGEKGCQITDLLHCTSVKQDAVLSSKKIKS